MSDGRGAPHGLSVDHALNPLSLGGRPNRLFWRLPHGEGVPWAMEAEAASDPALLASGSADLWCSGRLPYLFPWIDWPAEAELAPRSGVWWRVRVIWDGDEVGPWSAPARFAVALGVDDWAAQWITHPAEVDPDAAPAGLPVLVRDFTIAGATGPATLYITAVGVYEATVNGHLVGGALLGPGYSDIAVRHPAQAWDVTELLRPGANRLTVRLGTGVAWVDRLPDRYTKFERLVAPPRLLAQLELTEDGRRRTVGSDATWAASHGDDLVAHWYGGTDQRVRPVALAGPGCPPGDPVPAAIVGPVNTFAPPWWTATAPVRVVERLTGPRLSRPSPTAAVLDFGVNVAGQLRADLEGLVPGEPIVFRPAELLHDDGTVDQRSTGAPIYDRAVPTAPSGRFAPTLGYHGFRYVQVEGVLDDRVLDRVSVDVLRADLPRTGTFRSSDPYLNRLHAVIDRAVQSNMFSVFTDCPHREKLGWVEQLHLCFDVLSRSYDVTRHLAEQLVHIRDSQQADGMVPSTAPELVDFSGDVWRGDPNAFRDDPNWGGVIAILPWQLHRHSGDLAVLIDNWPAMRRHAAYLRSRETDGVVDFGLGDWVALDTSTPRALVATFGYHQALRSIARVAGVLGETAAAEHYAAEEHRVLLAFRRTFGPTLADPRWGSGSQASLSIALDMGAVPDDAVDAVFAQLVDVIERDGTRFTVGENALPSLLRVLSAGGRDDLVDGMVRSEDGPGYGHQLASGATALTESWQGPEAPSGQASQNHFMLGAVDAWLTSAVGGLAQAPGSVGWQQVVVAPRPLAGLDFAEVRFEAPSGPMRVRWDRLDDGRLQVEVSLPQGVSGELRLLGVRQPLPSGTTCRVLGLAEGIIVP